MVHYFRLAGAIALACAAVTFLFPVTRLYLPFGGDSFVLFVMLAVSAIIVSEIIAAIRGIRDGS